MLGLSPTAFVHVTAGMVGIVAGPVALLAPKGKWLHRKAGIAFYYAMLVMAGVAFVMAIIRVQKTNVFAAALTLYLVLTAWGIVRSRPGVIGRTERWAPWAAGAIAIGALTVAALVAAFPGRLYEGDERASDTPTMYIVFGIVAALSALTDVWTLQRGGLTGAARVSRHLWRMCLALAVALGSFAVQLPLLLRRMDLSPPPSLAGIAPALAVLALMVFWLVRVRMGRRYKPSAVAA